MIVLPLTSLTVVEFVDDTTVVGLISDNDETHYREEIQHLTQWCILNTNKTKELIVDSRTSKKKGNAPVLIHREAVEHLDSIKFLGLHITSDLTWLLNTLHLVKKAQQKLFFHRKLKPTRLCFAGCEFLQSHNGKHPLSEYDGSCTPQDRKNLAGRTF